MYQRLRFDMKTGGTGEIRWNYLKSQIPFSDLVTRLPIGAAAAGVPKDVMMTEAISDQEFPAHARRKIG